MTYVDENQHLSDHLDSYMINKINQLDVWNMNINLAILRDIRGNFYIILFAISYLILIHTHSCHTLTILPHAHIHYFLIKMHLKCTKIWRDKRAPFSKEDTLKCKKHKKLEGVNSCIRRGVLLRICFYLDSAYLLSESVC